jgi:uncharacterized protein YeeX (DUF496 family)
MFKELYNIRKKIQDNKKRLNSLNEKCTQRCSVKDIQEIEALYGKLENLKIRKHLLNKMPYAFME